MTGHSFACLTARCPTLFLPRSAAFGEAAYLAEGAPSGSWDSAGGARLLSGSLQAEQHAQQQAAQQAAQQEAGGSQAAASLPRASPFQGSHPAVMPPASP